jgi:hypothetical protein
MKSYGLFRKTIFSKSPKNAPLQFRNRGACWETKGIFEINYLNVLENSKKFAFGDNFFSSD